MICNRKPETLRPMLEFVNMVGGGACVETLWGERDSTLRRIINIFMEPKGV